MPPDPDAPRDKSVDRETLENVLDAKFATFELRLERMFGERLAEKIGQREHIELMQRVTVVEKVAEANKSWRLRITGALALASAFSVAAFSIAVTIIVRHIH